MKTLQAFVLMAALSGWSPRGSVRASDEPARESVTHAVAQIQRADYEGNRAELRRRYEELARFTDDSALAARVRYWRGFAMWRRAINGLNDSIDPTELEEDLQAALDEFKRIKKEEPGFADARIAMVSCLGNLIYLHGREPEKVQELAGQIAPLAKEAKEAAPNNPRLYWVMGPNLFIMPVERGGGQEKALAAYEKGLELARHGEAKLTDPLEPSWGEAELLMNIAWSQLNRTAPDLPAAERAAREALQLVPSWHYVRDILLPQILAAKAKVGEPAKTASE